MIVNQNMHLIHLFLIISITFGNKDNLKIEINFMNRVHVYKAEMKNISISFLHSFKTLTLNKYELYGSKIKALIERCTTRDVYDVYLMIKTNLFQESEYKLVKQCVIFYMVVGNTTNRLIKETLEDFHIKIKAFMVNQIPQYLSSTLKKDDAFSMIEATNAVKAFITKLMILNENEINFITEFENGNYKPELLFEDNDIIDKIKNHPMAIWKISNKKGK